MRTIILLSIIFSCFSTLAQEKEQIKFEKKKCNFGKIKTLDKLTYVFYFENTGDSPLVVQRVSTTCGCTVSEWTKSPIQKGQKGFIKVFFDPKGMTGKFLKNIYVKSTAENAVVILKIEGEII